LLACGHQRAVEVSTSRITRSILAFTAVALLLGWGIASAEVSTTFHGERGLSTLLMDRVAGITDGADPIPQLRWNQYRRVNPKLLLNVSGAVRHDGRPDVGFHPEIGWPFVTWAYNNGNDHDIAFSYWEGTRWSETEFLTSELTDDVDPRIFVSPQHAVSVVWAVEGPDPRVLLSSRRIGETAWKPAIRLTSPNEIVAHPSIVAMNGTTWVAYERWRNVDGDATPTVVTKRARNDDTGLIARAFPSQRSHELDPVLHVNAGVVWMDWKFSDDAFAYVILEGPGDHEVHLMPWADSSWVGVESVRLLIQRRVMGFAVPSPDVGTDGSHSNTP
jgi:hypothetical protein